MWHRFLSVDEQRVLLVGYVLLDGHALVLQVTKRLLGVSEFLHQSFNGLLQFMNLVDQSAIYSDINPSQPSDINPLQRGTYVMLVSVLSSQSSRSL